MRHGAIDEEDEQGGAPIWDRRGARAARRYALLCVALFFLLGFLPAFDYARFLPPEPDAVEMRCAQVKLEREDGHFVAGRLVIDGVAGEARALFHATVLWRRVHCEFRRAAAAAAGGDAVPAQRRDYAYRLVLPAILEPDVAACMANLTARYERPYAVWNYGGGASGAGADRSFRNHTLDEHDLAAAPIDRYEDFFLVYCMVKLFLLLLAALLTLLCAGARHAWRRLGAKGSLD